MRPRMALSAVVFPAPLGPMSPRMRPSSTRRLMPSSATVAPKVLRRPRASMNAMASALLFSSLEQFLGRQAEPLDGRGDPWPLFGEKLLPLGFEQQRARAGLDVHAQAPLLLDQLFVDELLIALQDRDRIDSMLGCDVPHGGQGIAFLEHPVENQGDDTVPELSVNWLAVVPFVHPVVPA